MPRFAGSPWQLVGPPGGPWQVPQPPPHGVPGCAKTIGRHNGGPDGRLWHMLVIAQSSWASHCPVLGGPLQALAVHVSGPVHGSPSSQSFARAATPVHSPTATAINQTERLDNIMAPLLSGAPVPHAHERSSSGPVS